MSTQTLWKQTLKKCSLGQGRVTFLSFPGILRIYCLFGVDLHSDLFLILEPMQFQVCDSTKCDPHLSAFSHISCDLSHSIGNIVTIDYNLLTSALCQQSLSYGSKYS